ncbi:unnamed protein product [Orchesella dallaii]|uniref:RING-type domain-containing protein n=1 Tax=Orchesella dallaii TaxID=48710 RepID=A0ABP1R5R0_9HEXA
MLPQQIETIDLVSDTESSSSSDSDRGYTRSIQHSPNARVSVEAHTEFHDSDGESSSTASFAGSSLNTTSSNHPDSDSHLSDISQSLHAIGDSSSGSSGSNNGSNPVPLSDVSSTISRNSFRNGIPLTSSHENSGSRPLRLNFRIPSNSESIVARRGSDTSESSGGRNSPLNIWEEQNESAERNPSHPPPLGTSAMMTDPSSSRAGNGNRVESTLAFECTVCLETLDAPASIDVAVNPPEGAAGRSPQNEDMPMPGPSRGGRGGARGRNKRPALHTLSLTDVVTTHCGHLYHRVCLEKWFSEKGGRTCPSCRKATPANKVLQVFPSISADAIPQLRNNDNEAGPSAAAATTGADAILQLRSNENEAGPRGAAAIAMSGAAPAIDDGLICERVECVEFRDIHNTLVNDYYDLHTRLANLRDDDAIKQGQIQSLEEDNAKKNDEILRLQRELAETRTDTGSASTSTGAKRRRQ